MRFQVVRDVVSRLNSVYEVDFFLRPIAYKVGEPHFYEQAFKFSPNRLMQLDEFLSLSGLNHDDLMPASAKPFKQISG
jgi:hypothetical protein